jgi:hypothetical protein
MGLYGLLQGQLYFFFFALHITGDNGREILVEANSSNTRPQ